jgi:hypothetical protein
MDTAVLVAIITGVFALAVALYDAASSYRRERKLKKLGFRYDELLVAAKAKTDYEYNARVHLYQRFEPLLFQLVELGDYALDRIKNLTQPAVWPKLELAEDSGSIPGRPPMAKPDYELVSTLYGLFAPLVLVRFMSRQLTFVDLSLERRIEVPYYLATRIYGSFKDDHKLASMEPQLAYDPFDPDWRMLREKDPARYWWQGLTMGRLENILDVLSSSEPEPAGVPLLSFGEFERLYGRVYEEGDEWQRKALAVASNPLVSFAPEARPVYWRMLIAQACLYQALLRTRQGEDEFSGQDTEGEWMRLLRLEDEADFRWKGETEAPSLAITLDAAQSYIHRYVVAPRVSSSRRP